MIKEFAVDPTAFARWEDCRFIATLFSAGHGRVIANYPKRWKRMAFDAAKEIASPLELKQIEEHIRRMDDTVLLKRRRPARPNESWLENALQEHKRLPFTSVISSQAGENILTVADLDEAEHPIATPRGMSVARSANAMADAAGMMFEMGKHYKFIDPYFFPTNTYMQPMRAFVSCISSRAVDSNGVIIEVVCRDSGGETANNTFINNIRSAMDAFLPTTMELKITLFPKHLIHDRWILADWVGIKFGHGFGIGGDTPTVNLDLLDEATRRRHWEEYSQDD